MTSIVENAFDFAGPRSWSPPGSTPSRIAVEVRDDGPGFAPEVLAKLGEPYVTSRPGAEGSRTGHIGMGLGFFIAKTLLERTGADGDVSQWPPRRRRGHGALAAGAHGGVRDPGVEP